MTIVSDIRRPFNAITLVIALISLAASVYFYMQSQARRAPIFQAYEASQVFDADSPVSKITVLDELGKKIVNNIYVSEFVIWNDGEIPIEPEDVRSQITVEISEAERLLDQWVVSESNLGAGEFSITKKSEENCQCLLLSWKHLDPGHGARFGVMYVADAESELNVGGSVVSADIWNITDVPKKQQDIFKLWMLGSMVVILLLVAVAYLLRRRKEKKLGVQSVNKKIYVLAFASIVLLQIIQLVYLIVGPLVPDSPI